MRKPSDLTSAHAVIAVLGVVAIAGAASWAGEGLVARQPVAATPLAAIASPGSVPTGPKGFVRATINSVEACAHWSADSTAHAGTVTLDCDSRELSLVDLATSSGSCGRLVAQDRIYPIASCEAAEGTVVMAEHGGEPWMIGRCTCKDITVTFEVPVR
jgi:hypothetical protein